MEQIVRRLIFSWEWVSITADDFGVENWYS
jgi:hypothetical protein